MGATMKSWLGLIAFVVMFIVMVGVSIIGYILEDGS